MNSPHVPSAVPTHGLVGAYTMNDSPADSSGKGHDGHTSGVTTTQNRFCAPRTAYRFDGARSVLTIPDHDDFSVNTTGYLSISVWFRPEGASLTPAGELLYSSKQGTGYVHWLGKGDVSKGYGNEEWTFRIYSADNTEGRHNRISFYHFDYRGGKGPGSYVEEPVAQGVWIHLVASVSKPEHRIWLYKNGVLRDTDSFGPEVKKYSIDDADLRNGNAPVRMGSKDGESHFKGAIDNVYFYNRLLTPTEIAALYTDATP